MSKKIILLLVLLAPAPALLAQQSDHPAIENWRRNLSGATGQSGFSNLHAAVSQIEADVQSTFYDNTYAYVEATGIPSHLLGPFTGDGNPGIPGDKGHIWRINLDPQPATTLTETGLGAIGFFLNGVAMFNAEDARSWNNQGVWLRNAIFFERLGFGVGDGHPAMDFYHYHKGPSLLMAQLGENAINHSPLMGFALDGYPVYGPYGYSNANGTGAIRLITPSWQHRNITQRHTLPDGTNLNQNQWGPDISATYPIGAFIQDHHFIANSGDLDEHNGRLCITPEYPQGTYAYFITRDPQGESLYPYIVGPTYYGVPDLANAGGGGGPPGGGGGGAVGGVGGGGGGGGWWWWWRWWYYHSPYSNSISTVRNLHQQCRRWWQCHCCYYRRGTIQLYLCRLLGKWTGTHPNQFWYGRDEHAHPIARAFHERQQWLPRINSICAAATNGRHLVGTKPQCGIDRFDIAARESYRTIGSKSTVRYSALNR